ncbi:MAG TPA: hypothetical protein DIT01_12160 [Lentisphaeria bacterium]|nr:hypothetical protein [Lentisphaeria bacterium]
MVFFAAIPDHCVSRAGFNLANVWRFFAAAITVPYHNHYLLYVFSAEFQEKNGTRTNSLSAETAKTIKGGGLRRFIA